MFNESQFLKIFEKIYDQLFWKNHNFDLQGTYVSAFKFDFKLLKDIITAACCKLAKSLLIFDEVITVVTLFQ